MPSNDQVAAYYQQNYVERDRLGRRDGPLEFARTQELLRRYLPPPTAKIIDIGGGTGVYASWLAWLGYEVHLLDIVPNHVQEAAQTGTYSAVVGDARAIAAPDAYFDVALLLGPLYHLTEYEERQEALREARRVVKPGGLVIAAFISRGGVFLDGYVKGWIDKPGTIDAVREHTEGGASKKYAKGFGAIAYFHLPEEARAEVAAAGIEVIAHFGIEGPGWIAANFNERWQSAEGRNLIMESARICETHPELQVLSAHLLIVGRNP